MRSRTLAITAGLVLALAAPATPAHATGGWAGGQWLATPGAAAGWDAFGPALGQFGGFIDQPPPVKCKLAPGSSVCFGNSFMQGSPPPIVMNNRADFEVTISPHVVRVGQEFVVRIERLGNAPSPGACPSAVDFATLVSSKSSEGNCVYKATTLTNITARGRSGVAYFITTRFPEDDYFAVVKRKEGVFFVVGSVRDKERKGIPGVKVEVEGTDRKGKQRSFTGTTGADGRYRIEVKKGTYTVQPVGDPPGGPPAGKYFARSCTGKKSLNSCKVFVRDSEEEGADFRYEADRNVLLQFNPLSIAGDGLSTVFSEVLVRDARFDPIAGQKIDFSPPVDPLVVGGPRALVCGTDKRLYPKQSTAGPVFGSFQLETDDAGKINVELHPGTVPGDWGLQAATPLMPGTTRPASEVSAKDLAITRSRGSIPLELGALLQQASQNIASAPLGSASPQVTQNMLIEWLLQLKGNPAAGEIFRGTEFAPINATDPQGKRRGGILFYPAGIDIQALVRHLRSPGGPSAREIPFVNETQVLETDQSVLAGFLKGGQANQGDLLNLREWEEGVPAGFSTPEQPPHGRAAFGRLDPAPEEELTFLGFPYPPQAGTMSRIAFFNRCLRPSRSVTWATVHSPVNVLFRNSTGKRIGFDARGRFVNELPGVVDVAKGSDERTFVLPRGSYKAELTGTGAGNASIVFSSPAERVSVMSFRSRKGGKGRFSLASAGPSGGRFDGRRLTAARGVGLKASGLPRRLKAGKSRRVKVSVRDQFGDPVAGALISVRGGKYEASALADARGRATLTLKPAGGRALTARVSAPGYRTLRRGIAVR